jgi:DNA integrity scanning protein DisA with diadenylate cyclase activity
MDFGLFWAIFHHFWWKMSDIWRYFMIFHEKWAIYYPRKIIKKFRKMIKNIIFCIFLWIISRYFMKYFKNNFINYIKIYRILDWFIFQPKCLSEASTRKQSQNGVEQSELAFELKQTALLQHTTY